MKINFPAPTPLPNLPTVNSIPVGTPFRVLDGGHEGKIMMRLGDPYKVARLAENRIAVVDLELGELLRIMSTRRVQPLNAEIFVQ